MNVLLRVKKISTPIKSLKLNRKLLRLVLSQFALTPYVSLLTFKRKDIGVRFHRAEVRNETEIKRGALAFMRFQVHLHLSANTQHLGLACLGRPL